MQNKDKIHTVLTNAELVTTEIKEFSHEHKDSIGKTVETTSELMILLESNLTLLKKSMQDVNKITEQMNAEGSDFQELISDKKLYEKMLETTTKIDSLLTDVKKNPKRYFQIKVF